MLNRHTLSTGDNCINIQIDELKYNAALTNQERQLIKDEILCNILTESQKEKKRSFGLSLSGNDEVSAFHEDTQCGILDHEKFISLILSWHPDLPQNERISILEQIFSVCLNTINNNSHLSISILKNDTCHHLLRNILAPACLISIEKEISDADLKLLIESTNNTVFNIDNALLASHQIYIIRILLNILYEKKRQIEDGVLVNIFKTISLSNNELLAQFFVDIYYRVKCNYIYVGASLEKFICDLTSDYLESNQESPLYYIKRILTEPLTIFSEYDYDTVIRDLANIASQCTNIIQGRWVVTALFRILPLYKYHDAGFEYDDGIFKVISEFDKTLLRKLNFLQNIKLINLLNIFSKRRELSFLKEYENKYNLYKDSLSYSQKIGLQIEYASTIYKYLLNNDIDNIRGSRFEGYLVNGLKQTKDMQLLGNFITYDYKPLSIDAKSINKMQVMKWLLGYIEIAYNSYLEKLLKRNPYSIYYYRATSQVPTIKARINSTIVSYLKSLDDIFARDETSHYVRVISIIEFLKIAKSVSCSKMKLYVELALKINRYELLLHSRSLSYSIYYIHYYCPDVSEDIVISLLDSFVRKTEYQNSAPKLYWAVIACVFINKNELEMEFILAVYTSLRSVNRKLFQLALKKSDEFNLVIPGESITIINKYAGIKSILATVGKEYMCVPEYWNILATTIYNIKDSDEKKCLEISALFYSMAKCFSRELKNSDQKYCYNYIRSKSLFYITIKTQPPDFFFQDNTFYINQYSSQFFTYKDECCDPFFDLIQRCLA